MRNIIKKILKEDVDLDWFVGEISDRELPFKIIGQSKKPPKRRKVFSVTVTWMSGDADAFETTDMLFKEDDPNHFEEFVELCKIYGQVIRRDYQYHNWDELSRILEPIGYCIARWGKTCNGKDARDFFENDVFSQGEYPAFLDDLKIIYYDSDGDEYDVELK